MKKSVFLISLDDVGLTNNIPLLHRLTKRGIKCAMCYSGCKAKMQMKDAQKVGADVLIIRGEPEIVRNTFVFKRMDGGSYQEFPLSKLVEIIEK